MELDLPADREPLLPRRNYSGVVHRILIDVDLDLADGGQR